MNAVVIVGAGHAGGRAAFALREAGYSGRIVLIGEESHPPYERPPLSKELLAGAKSAEQTFLKPLDAYRDAAVELRLSTRVEKIDRAAKRVILSGGEEVAYDKLLLTTGARPRRLPLDGRPCSHLLYLRDIGDATRIGEWVRNGARLVVVGAGLIGLEIAATAREAGCEVTVVEAGPTPLMRVVAPEIGEWFAGQHRRRGVELLVNACVTSIGDGAAGATVVLADGRTLEADLVVVGIGAIPNDDLARDAGLAVDDGIIVDEFGRTSDPDIFAAGDAVRAFNPLLRRHQRLETWRNAQDQPVSVARVIAGGLEPYAEIPWFWTDQYRFNFQMAGLPEAWDQLVWRGSPDDPHFTVFYLQAGRVVAAAALNDGRSIHAATELIRTGASIDPADLARPAAENQGEAVVTDAGGGWVKVAELSEAPPGEIKGVLVGEQHVAICNIDGRLYASDNVCTHAFALLSDGWIEDGCMVCPLHGGRFEAATGKAMGDPVDCDLKTFPVRVVGEDIEVLIKG